MTCPTGASIRNSAAQPSQQAKQSHPVQHPLSVVTRITSYTCIYTSILYITLRMSQQVRNPTISGKSGQIQLSQNLVLTGFKRSCSACRDYLQLNVIKTIVACHHLSEIYSLMNFLRQQTNIITLDDHQVFTVSVHLYCVI